MATRCTHPPSKPGARAHCLFFVCARAPIFVHSRHCLFSRPKLACGDAQPTGLLRKLRRRDHGSIQYKGDQHTGQLYLEDDFHIRATHARASVVPFAALRLSALDARTWFFGLRWATELDVLPEHFKVRTPPAHFRRQPTRETQVIVYAPSGAFVAYVPASTRPNLARLCAASAMNAFTGGFLYSKVVIFFDEVLYRYRHELFEGNGYTLVREPALPNINKQDVAVA